MSHMHVSAYVCAVYVCWAYLSVCLLQGGRAVHLGGVYGIGTGEGPSAGDVPVHRVHITNHYQNNVIEVEVPQDR